jgi:predicted Zn-dependent peptidase
LPAEPEQLATRYKEVSAKVPLDALYLVFHTCGRADDDFYAVDLLSDVLGSGQSSRLYRRLLKERKLFSHIDCYITASMDPGLFILEGKPSRGVDLAAAEAAIWEELDLLKSEPIPDRELEKLINKSESTLEFSEASVLNKAINLAFFEMMGDAAIINEEGNKYRDVTVGDMQRVANQVFTRENCSVLHYMSSEPSEHTEAGSEEEE